jgi:hypothetical protein
MSKYFAVFSKVRVATFAGIATVALAVPLLGVSVASAVSASAESPATSATVNGDDWIG